MPVPAPDLGGLIVIFWAMMSVPIILGLIATILASSAGADAVLQLSRGRHLLAIALGSFLGSLCLAGVVAGGMLFTDSLGAAILLVPESLGAAILLVLVASVAGGLIGFQSAKLLSKSLNCYTCKACGARFRSQFASRECRRCAEDADRIAIATALVGSSSPIREGSPTAVQPERWRGRTF